MCENKTIREVVTGLMEALMLGEILNIRRLTEGGFVSTRCSSPRKPSRHAHGTADWERFFESKRIDREGEPRRCQARFSLLA